MYLCETRNLLQIYWLDAKADYETRAGGTVVSFAVTILQQEECLIFR